MSTFLLSVTLKICWSSHLQLLTIFPGSAVVCYGDNIMKENNFQVYSYNLLRWYNNLVHKRLKRTFLLWTMSSVGIWSLSPNLCTDTYFLYRICNYCRKILEPVTTIHSPKSSTIAFISGLGKMVRQCC